MDLKNAKLGLFKKCIDDFYNEGKFPRKGMSCSDMFVATDVYNDLCGGKNPTFIQSKVKELVEACGIITVQNGVGWKAIG